MDRGNEEEERAKLLGSLKMVPVEAVNRDGSVKAEYFNQMLPPGFRFDPSDEELMLLLCKKINNETMPFHKICVVDVYAVSPQQLTREHTLDREEEWYFFSSRNRKYPNGSRPNRAAGFGFWKPTGSETLFTDGNQNFTKTSLDYYIGVHKQSKRTDWKMHEFVFKDVNVPSKQKRTRNGDLKLNDWVLCRIYKSSRSGLGDTTIAEMNPVVFATDNGGQVKDSIQAFSNHATDHAVKDTRFFQNSSQVSNEKLTNAVSSSNQRQQSESSDPTFINAPCQIAPDSIIATNGDPTSANVKYQDLVTTSKVDPNDNDNWLSNLNDMTFSVEEITRILDEDDQGLNDLLTNNETLVAWKAPDDGWIKLNLNVKCNNKNGGQGQAVCSGVFRDCQGQWLLGFILNLSPGYSELADLWVLQMGLQLASQKGFKSLCVESESGALMELLKNGCAPDHSGAMLVSRVKEMVARKDWEVRLELISEKANMVARDVAEYGLGFHIGQGVQVLQQPPNDCLAALTFDMMSSPKYLS